MLRLHDEGIERDDEPNGGPYCSGALRSSTRATDVRRARGSKGQPLSRTRERCPWVLYNWRHGDNAEGWKVLWGPQTGPGDRKDYTRVRRQSPENDVKTAWESRR